MPRHRDIPVVLLGRLARDLRYRRRGCGEPFLLDALHRAHQATSEVAAFAVVADAADERAAAFYGPYGFAPLPDRPRRMFLPVRTVEGLVAPAGAAGTERQPAGDTT